jgi:hypothetical protein
LSYPNETSQVSEDKRPDEAHPAYFLRLFPFAFAFFNGPYCLRACLSQPARLTFAFLRQVFSAALSFCARVKVLAFAFTTVGEVTFPGPWNVSDPGVASFGAATGFWQASP